MTTNYDEEIFDGEIALTKLKDIPALDNLYLVSATPTLEQAKLMEGPLFCNDNPFVANIGARDAINSGDILPVKATIVSVSDKRNNDVILNVINHLFDENKQNNGPVVRCLVTETTVENLKSLRDVLISANIPVFYTTGETGKWSAIKNGNEVIETNYKSITEFAKAINEFEKDCIVLHIRQVIAGVDISGLTHTIIRNCANTQRDTVRMIQTIGRTLRYYNSKERIAMAEYKKNPSMSEPVLTKKYGQVYFLLNKDSVSYEEEKKHVNNFLFVTYNLSGTAVSSYDLLGEKKPGNHETVQVQGQPFTHSSNVNANDITFEDYIFNDDWVKLAINMNASDTELADIVKNAYNGFVDEFQNESIYQAEYMAVILKHREKFEELFDIVRKKRDELYNQTTTAA